MGNSEDETKSKNAPAAAAVETAETQSKVIEVNSIVETRS
jgi:hypothetical protein